MNTLKQSLNKNASKYLKNNSKLEFGITVVLVLFVLLNVSPPEPIAEVLDNKIVQVVLYSLSATVMLYNPLLSALLIALVYNLVKSSQKQTGTYQRNRFLPDEFTKNKELNAYNQFPKTLEEEMVDSLVPISNDNLGAPSYKAKQDELHDAAQLE